MMSASLSTEPTASTTLLVIPVYNDTARLAPFLKELLATLPAHFSILVSDDGSEPAEQERLATLIQRSRELIPSNGPTLFEVLSSPRNTGKGGAVYRGWDSQEGFSLLSFADADGAVSAGEILRAESTFRSDGCIMDALFASRVKMMGRSVTRSLHRHLLGRIFATLVSELGGIPAYDTQCGFKILKVESYREIRPCLKTMGFAFDVELALLLNKSGKRIMEFPIDWHDVQGSKIRLGRDSLRMFLEVIKIRRRLKTFCP